MNALASSPADRVKALPLNVTREVQGTGFAGETGPCWRNRALLMRPGLLAKQALAGPKFSGICWPNWGCWPHGPLLAGPGLMAKPACAGRAGFAGRARRAGQPGSCWPNGIAGQSFNLASPGDRPRFLLGAHTCGNNTNISWTALSSQD